MLDPASIAQELAGLIEEDKVQNIDTKIFNNSLFFAEEGIRSHIGRLLEKGKQESFEAEKIEQTIDDIEEDLHIHYDPIQRKAIQEAIQQKVFVLTGGPGTGKTTVINGIIGNLCPSAPIGSSDKISITNPLSCSNRSSSPSNE